VKPTRCIIEGCAGKANVPGTARGYCIAHYNRWRRHGLCQAAWGCDAPAVTHVGLCERHLPAGIPA
jgi:hypothetical protein